MNELTQRQNLTFYPQILTNIMCTKGLSQYILVKICGLSQYLLEKS